MCRTLFGVGEETTTHLVIRSEGSAVSTKKTRVFFP